MARGDHAGLAVGVHRLLEDGRLASELVANARREVREHDWEAVRPRWVALYRELLEGRTGHGDAS